jgi:hypothetical protein
LSFGGDQGDAEVGDDSEVSDGEVVDEAWVLAGVGDDDRLACRDYVLAEGVAEGCLPTPRPWLRETQAALEVLTISVNGGDECDGCADDPRRDPGESVERFFGWRVEQGESRRAASLPGSASACATSGTLRFRPEAREAISAIESSASGSPRAPAGIATRMIVAARTNCAALTPTRSDSRTSIAHRSSPNLTVVAFMPHP